MAAKAGISYNAMMQQQKIAFESFLGSGKAAEDMLTNAEQLEAMGLDELDQLRVTVMVFGAFTAGVFTAKRVIEAGQ